MKEYVRLFKDLKFNELYDSSEPRSQQPRTTSSEQEDSLLQSCLIKAASPKTKDGELSRAANLLTSSGLANGQKIHSSF